MECIAIEALRTALQNPAFAENINRRRASFSSVQVTNGNGLLSTAGHKIGSFVRRMSNRSNSSSASATPVASPITSRSSSRTSSPTRIAIAIPVMSVVDAWPASPITPSIYYPPLPPDHISSSLDVNNNHINPLHENNHHHEYTNVEQRLHH